MISALATASASVIALGIATFTEVKLRSSAKRMAGLHAATCLAQLKDIEDNASRVATFLGFQKAYVVGFPKFPVMLPTRWESAIGIFDAHALVRLEALPNNAAYRAAEAIGSLRAIGEQVREFERGNAGWGQMDAGVRKEHLDKFHAVFNEAHVTLRAALLDFQRAARLQIRPLSPEERGYVVD
ncbi:hypothetical protein IB236_17515 [Acidovorax sp. ACV02]|uniref:hypothetical protein n=1 Tax=Acidovorax sp. ACV02 TaxID=2769310 RepID=UPI00177C9E51|nr:hypothetical protein [Acidovorax sp. ACV02]MBD9407147.1 hypothetical protein [Acidovorax sp. ACV02]